MKLYVVALACLIGFCNIANGAQDSVLRANVTEVGKTNQSIATMLQRSGMNFSVDQDGDYVILMSDEKSNVLPVYIVAKTTSFDIVEVQEVFAIAANGLIVTHKMATTLLKRNNTIKIGSWSIAKTRAGGALIFTIKVPVNALDSASLKQLINFVAVTVTGMKEEIASGNDLWSPF